MGFTEISPWDFKTAPVRLVGRERMLLLSRSGERRNGMAVSWGGIGVMWGAPVIFYAVRPSRYTYTLTEEGSKVSFCSLPPSLSTVFSYFGTSSGRDADKFAAAGIHPYRMPCGGDGIVEAACILTAEKVYAHSLCAEELCDATLSERWYASEPFHTLYFAKIAHIYVSDKEKKEK